MIVFSKRFDAELGLYVFFRDNRAKGGNVTVDVWFAPIQMPDSTIEVLGVGIHAVALSRFEISDEIMRRSTLKAIWLASSFDIFENTVRAELEHPVVENRRTKVFAQMRSIYAAVSSCNVSEAVAGLSELRACGKAVWEGKEGFEQLENACEQFLLKCESVIDLGAVEASLPNRKKGSFLAEMLVAQSI